MQIRLYRRGLVVRDAPPASDPTAGRRVAEVILAAYGAAALPPAREWPQGEHEVEDWREVGEEHRLAYGHPVRYFPDGAECRICDIFWIAPVSPEQQQARDRAKRALGALLGVPLDGVDLVDARWTEGICEGETTHAELAFELHGRLPPGARRKLPASTCWSRNGFVTTGTLRFTAADLERLLSPSSSGRLSATPPPAGALAARSGEEPPSSG